MAVIDPAKSSLDCIKFIMLPENFVPFAHGPYFVIDEEADTLGIVVAAEKDKQTRIYFMKDHSLSIDFFSNNDFNGYFNQPRKSQFDYVFHSKNILTGKSKEMNISIDIEPRMTSTEIVEINKDGKGFEVNLVEQDGKPKYFDMIVATGTNQYDDLVKGYPYKYDFVYDSWIENYSGKITAEFHCKVEQYPADIVAQLAEMISYKPVFVYHENTFKVSPLERLYQATPDDYADLLYASIYITTPIVELRSRSQEVQSNIHMASSHRCSKLFYQFSYVAEVFEVIVCLKLQLLESTDQTGFILVYLFNERPGAPFYSALRTETPIANITVDLIKTPFSDYNIVTTLNHYVIRLTNEATRTTYSYSIYRLKKVNNVYSSDIVYVDNVWMTDLRVSNQFYQNPITGIITERFCLISISTSDSIVFCYYCFEYDSLDMLKFNPVVKTAPIFDFIEVEDLMKFPPILMIFNEKVSPVSTTDYLVRDPSLYFMISFQAYMTIFAKLDPKEDTSTTFPTSFKYGILCNPFEGFKFDKEFHSYSDRYYSKVSVLGDKSYLSFYNLPSAYTDMKVSTYSPLYRPQEFAEGSQNKPKCIESKYIHILDFATDKVYPLRFVPKNIPEAYSLLQKEPDLAAIRTAANLFSPPLVFNKKSLQLLLRDKSNRFHRLEYLPRITIKTTENLLLSDFIKVSVKGLFNSTTDLQINLISLKITQFWLVIKYILPILILTALIIGFNSIMAYVFRRIKEQTSYNKEGLTKSGLGASDASGGEDPGRDSAASSVLNGKKKVGKVADELEGLVGSNKSSVVNGLDSTIDEAASARSSIFDAKSFLRQKSMVGLEYKIQQENERESKMREAVAKIRHKREALGIPLVSEDPDFVDDLTHADYVRNLYSKGVLEMDMDTENAEIVNRAVAEEGARSLIDIMAEKEEGLEVPLIKEKELQDFENYLRTRSSLGAIMGEVRNIVLPKVVEEVGEEDDIELAGEGFTPDGLKKSTESEVISKEDIDEIDMDKKDKKAADDDGEMESDEEKLLNPPS